MDSKIKNNTILLSPAGDYDCFLAAINAGADAVYLAGDKFGARAYAGNFTQEEVIRAIRSAHLFSKQVHLTLNTLVKEYELNDIIPFLRPLAEEGLDAVIVQDMGVARLIKSEFPKLPLHASTQMSVTQAKGARMLKDYGFSQVITARECSMEDIRDICEVENLDVEVFIHGAMCYSYSGKCLFSSMLGERSANRGRCAGPCRMEYSTKKSDDKKYLLSLSDLCAINYLPDLINAGVKSFKIEGRMKPVQYVSTITAIYRKYIDRFMEKGEISPDKEDIRILEGIYHRGKINAGYLERNRGHQAVTLDSPAYRKMDDDIVSLANRRYENKDIKLSLSMKIKLFIEKPMELELCCKNVSVTVFGDEVQPAKKAPISREDVVKQLKKMGDTAFAVSDIEVDLDDNVFCAVKSLNELRRKGVVEIEKKLLCVKLN